MDWRKKAQQEVQDKQMGNKFKLQVGSNTFRVLPNYLAVKKDNYRQFQPRFTYLAHFNVGPNKKICRCGKDPDTLRGECWLCDEIIEKYSKSGKTSKRTVAKELEPKVQTLMQVARWDRGSETLRGPYKFFVPASGGGNSLAVKLIGLISGSKRFYDHPKKGYNITVTRTGTGKFDTRYGTPEPDETSSVVPKSIIRKIEPFKKLIDGYDEEFQRALFYGEDIKTALSKRRVEEEEDDTKELKMAKRKTKKSKKDENEQNQNEDNQEQNENDQNENNEQNQNENDEDEKPKKGKKGKKVAKKKKKSKKDDDNNDQEENQNENDEQDENEQDENDEDEKPKKKKKVKKAKKGKKSKKDEDNDQDENQNEDNNDDEEENNNEEDEKPKKKKKKGKK